MSRVKPIKIQGNEHITDDQALQHHEDLLGWLDPSSWDYGKFPLDVKYEVRTETVEVESDGDKNYWDTLKCEIYALHEYWWEQGIEPKTKIGEYGRNYPNLMKTFHPFHYNGQDYALYSPDYTATRVMKLPECIDIGGEEPKGSGFCPSEYFVPCPQQVKSSGSTEYEKTDGSFGFVAGCVWGDDTSMKIQFLDLSNIEKGELIRDSRFGYHELPAKVSLEKAVNMNMYNPDYDEYIIEIASFRRFSLEDETMKLHGYSDGIHDINEGPDWKYTEIKNED